MSSKWFKISSTCGNSIPALPPLQLIQQLQVAIGSISLIQMQHSLHGQVVHFERFAQQQMKDISKKVPLFGANSTKEDNARTV